MKSNTLNAFLCVLCVSAVNAFPQEHVVRSGVQEVLVDVIVRDKAGRLVRDIKPEEVSVYDEGTKQKITGFRLVTIKDQAGITGEQGQAEAARTPVSPMRQLRLVSFLFEGMDAEQRGLARQAAVDFLKDPLDQNVFMAVFIVDHGLQVVQQFTNDRVVLAKAVERATSGSTAEVRTRSAQIRKQLNTLDISGTGAASAGAGGYVEGQGPMPVSVITNGRQSGPDPHSVREANLSLVLRNVLEASDSAFRADPSRSSLFALLALAKEQRALPGRKTILYFAPGLTITDQMAETYKDTIAAANRAGVSIYGIDPRGLMSEAQNRESILTLDRATATYGQPTGRPAAMAVETARNSIYGNVQESLATVAYSTGGRLIANTNDLRGPLRQVREDILAYYELTFVSPAKEFDGRYRKLEVKVSRPNAQVQARAGYFALAPKTENLNAFETPLLHVLSLPEFPKAFPFRTAALRFGRAAEDRVAYGLVLEVPMNGLAFTAEPEKNRRRSHISFLLLLKDQQGQVVQRFSRDLGFYTEPDKLEAYKKRNFIGTFHVDLAPGRYALESAVLDREAMQASARRISVVVLPAGARVGISSLTFVRRTDAEGTPADGEDPFYVDGKRIVPALESTFRLSTDPALSVYFVVTPAAGGEPLKAAMELSKNGQVVAAAPIQLPEANTRGVIPYVASLPLAKLTPGEYELRIVAVQGEAVAEARAAFSLMP